MKDFKKRSNFIRNSFWMLLFLISISWIFIYLNHENDLFAIFTSKNNIYLQKFIKNLLGIGKEKVAYLDPKDWTVALKLSAETFVMSIVAIGFATLGMLVIVFPTARNVVSGELTYRKRWYYWPLFHVGRFLFLIGRAVPELLWAMILLYFFKPGLLPGALALALHNFGILGKLVAELIEDMDDRPIQNMIVNGASTWQVFLYGLIPELMPKTLNYILYRFENIIRASLIVGIVGAGGLGMQFRLAMSFFRYTDITLYLLCYLIMVYFSDLLSAWCKKFIKVS
ncbi:ABC transporter permease [Facklamia sp. 7083-14-GEN3]|uniref:PhnE/PtxC family ABC transporter permease n=1 Tax=Facklamia sp. 7083-14-GEN3 TaxID=2973478 RepID=UPI00215D2892|nr:ABC transporter permease subunit [Facklamia sp. 7083-14-GEN3]MCR8969913.1 ABC transporter permease subunit [Facklamia sp. 7083-14-GEN3]